MDNSVTQSHFELDDDATLSQDELRKQSLSTSSSGKQPSTHSQCRCDRNCCKGFLRRNLLLLMLIASLAIGVAMGIGLRFIDEPFDKRELMYFRFPGELLMRMLKALVIPLIVSSLVSGLAGMDTKSSGKMGLYSIIYYMSTTFSAALLGILLVCTIQPGKNSSAKAEGSADPGNIADSFLDLLRNIFPDNIVEACFRQTKTYQVAKTSVANMTYPVNSSDPRCNNLASVDSFCNYTSEESTLWYDFSVRKEDGVNALGLVVYSLALGVAVGKLGEVGKPLYRVCLALAEATMTLVTAVIWYSPIGIMFLVASEVLGMKDPMAELEALGMYMVTVLTGLAIHGGIILPLIYLVVVRKNPFKYLLGALQALVTAFGTASSSATLPVTYYCLEENNKIDNRVTRFILPVGATINMDGTALYEAVAAIFIAQTNGMNLNAAQVVAISITATLASIGAASVPQAGLVTMVMVLSSIGLPAEEVTKILAVDWLLDRFRTAVNVEGDAIGAGIVDYLCRDQLRQGVPEGPADTDEQSSAASELSKPPSYKDGAQTDVTDVSPSMTSSFKNGAFNNAYVEVGDDNTMMSSAL